MYVPILSYEVDWQPKSNQYRINIWVVRSANPILVPVNTETEFVAILIMLGRPGVLFETTSGNFQLPPRPTGT